MVLHRGDCLYRTLLSALLLCSVVHRAVSVVQVMIMYANMKFLS